MVMDDKEIKNDLPLTEATFFILLSLAPTPKHGYAILKEVEALSSGRIVFSTGTLYGALKRLLEQEWIQREEDDNTDRSRKTYSLTQKGRHILMAEVARLQTLVQAARQHIITVE